ncbi:MAG: hypothetical protein ACKV2V_12815 [Blastocatellia bacterium]
MTRQEKKYYAMFRRVREFGQEQQAGLDAGSQITGLLARLEPIINDMESGTAMRAAKHNVARAGALTRAQAREALTSSLLAINRGARLLASEQPGMAGIFAMPERLNDETLLATAQAFLVAATPLAADFVRQELRPDFLETLTARIAAFTGADRELLTATNQRSAARGAINETVDEGLDIVRRLDLLIRNRFDDNHAVLGRWEMAKRIRYATRAGAAAGAESETVVAQGASAN